MSFFEKLKDNHQITELNTPQDQIDAFIAKGVTIKVVDLKDIKHRESAFIKAFSPKFKQYRKNHPKTDIDLDPDKPLT